MSTSKQNIECSSKSKIYIKFQITIEKKTTKKQKRLLYQIILKPYIYHTYWVKMLFFKQNYNYKKS